MAGIAARDDRAGAEAWDSRNLRGPPRMAMENAGTDGGVAEAEAVDSDNLRWPPGTNDRTGPGGFAQLTVAGRDDGARGSHN